MKYAKAAPRPVHAVSKFAHSFFTYFKWMSVGNSGVILETASENGGQAVAKVWRGFEYLISPENRV